MSEVIKYTISSIMIALLLFSCCGNEDCGDSLFLILRFEDDSGNNLISNGTLLPDSIKIINVYDASVREGAIHSVDDDGNPYVQLLYGIDSIKIKIGNEIVRKYDIKLSDYREKGCCDGYKNFNVYSDHDSCLSCFGNPVRIVL